MPRTPEIHLYPGLALWPLGSQGRHENLEVCPSLLLRQKPGIRAAGCLLGFWHRLASQLRSPCTCPRAHSAWAVGASGCRGMEGGVWLSLATPSKGLTGSSRPRFQCVVGTAPTYRLPS